MIAVLAALLLANGPAAARVEKLARADLAASEKIAEGKIQTRSVQPVTWPDAGLGCPEPGKMYAQVETRGYLIELEARGKVHRYHSDLRRVVRCDR